MSLSESRDTVIIFHPVHQDVGRRELLPALAEDERALPHFVRIEAIPIPYGEASIDWDAAVRAQLEQLHEAYEPLLEKLDSPRVIYAGRAPIPLVVHLGHRIGPYRELRARQPHHGPEKHWYWDDAPVDGLEVHADPVPSIQAEGDVVVRVSTFSRIDPLDTQAVVPSGKALIELDIFSTPVGIDVMHHPESIAKVARAFRETFDTIRDNMPNVRAVHLFAAVPLALACDLGHQIQSNVHPAVLAYQYDQDGEPRYTPALFVQRGEGAERELTAEERASANEARSLWAIDCERLASFVAGLEGEDWVATACSGLSVEERARVAKALPPRWDELPHAGSTALSRAIVSGEPLEDGRPFGFNERDAAWMLSDRFLFSVSKRIPDPDGLQLAGTLFLLHETLHRQVHGLTENTARGIGQFPKAIEAADYQADLWALLHAARFYEAESPEFLERAIRVATETMWSFTGAGAAVFRMELRAVNRFLNWYWQLAQIEGASLGGAVETLATPPTIELRGPKVVTLEGRPALQLVGSGLSAPRLVVWTKNTVVAIGENEDSRLADLIEGLAKRDGDAVFRALRWARDSIPALPRES